MVRLCVHNIMHTYIHNGVRFQCFSARITSRWRGEQAIVERRIANGKERERKKGGKKKGSVGELKNKWAPPVSSRRCQRCVEGKTWPLQTHANSPQRLHVTSPRNGRKTENSYFGKIKKLKIKLLNWENEVSYQLRGWIIVIVHSIFSTTHHRDTYSNYVRSDDAPL